MKLKHFIFAFLAMLSCFGFTANAESVAKVGNTEYATIDEAIAAWTNNTTLTLLSDVTLSDVVTLKSTEHHILNLGTYTMTAAKGKNAFVIKAYGTGDSERTAITINADATNPGGINAGSKCVVYYKYADGGISTNDRPIIKINGGVFTGTTSTWGTAGIYTIGTEARKCATLNISGGTFNCSINGSGKSKLIISGGVFNYSVGSQGDKTAYRLISGGKFKTLGFMTADSNNTKFWFGTSMANSNVGLFVDDEGYLCVGGPVITELGPKYKAVASNATKWSGYLAYSSAATNGLYYTNAEAAIKKHGAANVTVWEKPAVTIPENVTGDANVVKEIKNNTALNDYTPANLPAGAELEIVLESVGETFVYDVTPMVDGVEVEPTQAITFRLPVPESVKTAYAKVYHEGTLMGLYEIKGEGNAKYVEISSADFSVYTVEPTTPVAKIGETAYATLSAAFAAVTDDAQTVVICKDVTENLTATLRGNITTENGAKVTITLTNSDWVYCPYIFVLGENVTMNVPALFYYAGGAQINGTLVVGAYYQRYAGTKLTINEPGSMEVTGETCIIRYMDGDANAGIYVVGDNNNETIGLKLAVAYFYQGMINAKDANIVAGTYWQTNETDGQGSANLVLDNSTLTVTVYDHPAKATGNSTVTLTNGSVIDAKNGGFTYGDNTTLSVDATSKIIGKNGVLVELPVASVGDVKYYTLEEAFKAATESQTITLVDDATPVLKSQSAITKAAVIDLGGKTLTLTEDDLYFGTTTFKNGTIVVDPSVKPSTAVFWMFADQTLTFDNVKIVATGVTGTYLIGLDGNNSDLNLLNGSEILVENTTALDLDIICVNASTGNDIKVENSKVNVKNLDGRVFFRGNYTVKGASEINLSGITKAGFRIEAGQTLSIQDNAKVTIEGEPRDGGIHLTDATSKYTKAATATVTATLNEVKQGHDFNGYVGTDAIWGEVWGNARESFVIKVLDANGNVMGSTSLNNIDGIINGNVNVTWNLKFDAASNTDSYWTMQWTTAPSINNMPAKVELWVDGVKVSGGNVVLNGPDDLNKIVAAVTDENGVIKLFATKFEDAVKAGDNVAILKAGKYALKVKNNLTITGAVDGVEFTNIGAFGCDGANVTFNNVTFTYANEDYKGLQHSGNLVYNNCTINGQVFLYGASETFNKCTFNQTSSNAYNVWTYTAAQVAFNECTFNSAGKSVLIYREAGNTSIDVAVSKSQFNASQAVEGKAAIEMDSSLSGAINLTIDGETTATGFATGNVSGNSLWNNKKGNNNEANNDITVTVGGKTVLAPVTFVAKIGNTSYKTLADAVAAVKEGETVTILAGTHSEGAIKLPATLKNVTFKGAEGAILKDMTISAADGNAYSYVGLTFDGITFDNSRILLTGWRNGDETIENLTVTNCTFKNLNDNTNTAPVHINKDASEAVKNFTFTNNVIDGATGGSKSGVYAQLTGDVVFTGNVINNVAFRPYVIQLTTDDGIADNFTVTGNTFSGSAAGRAQGLGNNAEGTDAVNLVVSNNIFKGITESQQICYWNFNAEKTTADLSGNYYDIDIVANPSRIYFNSAATGAADLVAMKVFPIYTALNEDGTINMESAYSINGVATKAELNNAITNAKDGETIVMIADIDYGTDQLAIAKAITLDLGGKTLTTRNAYGGMSIKGNPTVKNGNIVHASNTAAIKVWNATAFEDLVIDVQGKGDANKTIGGIVLQSGSTTRVGSIKNVTIKGAALTNGIETYNCGDATENVIGAMENVTIDAQGTGMLISAPCGTATNCSIKGGTNGIEIWIKGNYSASLDLKNSTVEGGVYAHDEFNSNPGVVNIGKLSLTADEKTTGASAADVTLTLARAENVAGVVKEVKESAKAKVNDTYYATLDAAIKAAKAGDVVTVFEGTYAMPAMKAGITIVGQGNVMFEGTLTGTLENLTMKNIHIKGGNAQRWAYAKGNLVFENVTFEATSVYALHFDGITAGATLSYKNCTIIGWAAMSGSPASCKFDGCTFNGNGTYGLIRTYFDATIENCTFDVADVNTKDKYQDGIHAVNGATVTVTNCTNANGDMKEIINIEGTSAVVLDGQVLKNVAKVGDKKFATLDEAIKAADANGKVTLLQDITLTATTNISKAITLDGDNHKLTVSGNGVNALTVSAAKDKTVTFKNLEIECTGYGAGSITAGIYNTGKNKLVLENVKVLSSNYGIFSSTDNIVVNNSTLKGDMYAIYSSVEADIQLNGSTLEKTKNYGAGSAIYVQKSGSKLDIVKSTITAYAPQANIAAAIEIGDNNVEMNIDENSTITIEGNNIYVVYVGDKMYNSKKITNGNYNIAAGATINKPNAMLPTIFIKDSNVQLVKDNVAPVMCFTLQDAVNDVAEGQTVQLINNLELSEVATVAKDKSVTLDLNGKTLSTAFVDGSTTNHLYAIHNYGELTITDSSDAKAGKISARGNFNYGKLTLEAGTIDACDGNGGYAVKNFADSEFIMNGGAVTASYEDGDEPTKGYDATTVRVESGAKATINGGVINNSSNYTFAIDNAGEVTVNGGTVTSVHSTVSNYGTMTINGGSFTCNGLEGVTAHALVVWDGSTTTINNGTFDGKNNYNGFNVCASKGANVVITGGNFLSVHSGSLYGEGTITVSGGTFFDKIEDSRCALGYQAVANAEGTYGVTLTNKRDSYTIEDGKVAEFKNEHDIEVGTLTYKRTFNNANWQALYLPFEVPVSALSDQFDITYIYDVHTEVDEQTYEPTGRTYVEQVRVKSGTLQANYPYLIRRKADADKELVLTLTDATLCKAVETTIDCSSVLRLYEVTGTYHKMTPENGLLGMWALKSGVWERATESSYLNPFRVYIKITDRAGVPVDLEVNSVRMFIRGEEEVTGINGTKFDTQGENFIYDLQGRRVANPVKGGIYIINGKKVYYNK